MNQDYLFNNFYGTGANLTSNEFFLGYVGFATISIIIIYVFRRNWTHALSATICAVLPVASYVFWYIELGSYDNANYLDLEKIYTTFLVSSIIVFPQHLCGLIALLYNKYLSKKWSPFFTADYTRKCLFWFLPTLAWSYLIVLGLPNL